MQALTGQLPVSAIFSASFQRPSPLLRAASSPAVDTTRPSFSHIEYDGITNFTNKQRHGEFQIGTSSRKTQDSASSTNRYGGSHSQLVRPQPKFKEELQQQQQQQQQRSTFSTKACMGSSGRQSEEHPPPKRQTQGHASPASHSKAHTIGNEARSGGNSGKPEQKLGQKQEQKRQSQQKKHSQAHGMQTDVEEPQQQQQQTETEMQKPHARQQHRQRQQQPQRKQQQQPQQGADVKRAAGQQSPPKQAEVPTAGQQNLKTERGKVAVREAVEQSRTHGRGVDVQSSTRERGVNVQSSTRERGVNVQSSTRERGVDVQSSTRGRGVNLQSSTRRIGVNVQSSTRERGANVQSSTRERAANVRVVSKGAQQTFRTAMSPALKVAIRLNREIGACDNLTQLSQLVDKNRLLFNEVNVCTAMRLTATLSSSPRSEVVGRELMEELSVLAIAFVDNLDPQGCSNTLLALAKLNVKPRNGLIARVTRAAGRKLRETTPQGLANTLHCLAKLDFR
eukprot:gene15829-21953_t